MATRHRKPFLVRTSRDLGDLPEGSGVWVNTTLKHRYPGVWSSQWGSYTVTVPKKACRKARRGPASIT